MIGARATAILAMVLGSGVAGCSGDRTTGTSTSAGVTHEDAGTDGGLCARWPKAADTFDASAMTGCSPSASLNMNGENVCDGATEYALVCNRANPDPALECHVAWPPSPGGGGGRNCCPCRE